jgi:putative transposase
VTAYINREARRRGACCQARYQPQIRTAMIQSLTVDADYDRMDPLNRVAGKSFAKKRIRAAFPFARIEQDALHLPFVVRTPSRYRQNRLSGTGN